MWDDSPTEPPPVYGSEIEEEERPPKPPPAIMGPTTTTFPRNIGWYMEHQEPIVNGKPRKLSDLTIHNITAHLTSFVVKNAKPNCIENWTKRIGHPLPFDDIFKSFGTPLSDPTEERQWRKLVHRAKYVRSRNPPLVDKRCRLCKRDTERILHLFQCMSTAPLWRACITFCESVIGITRPSNIREAIIFGIDDRRELLHEAARAFLRHAYNCFYHDFANVDLKDATFHWQFTFNAAIKSFRDAVLRCARRIQLLCNTRLHTNLQGVVPQTGSARAVP